MACRIQFVSSSKAIGGSCGASGVGAGRPDDSRRDGGATVTVF